MARQQKSIRQADWPAEESDRLRRAIAPGKRRHQAGPAAHWSKATHRLVFGSYGCSLGWLNNRKILNWAVSPAARWTEPVLEAYLMDLQANYAKATVFNRISSLERALAALDPSGDRELVIAMKYRLGPPGPNMAHEGRTQPSSELLQLGLDLMAQAERGEHRSPRLVAALFRTGLQIALLALRFWRIGEFHQMIWGTHLYCDDAGVWRTWAEADETKCKKRPRRGKIPMILVEPLERYLEHFRVALCNKVYDGQALWVSTRARQQSQNSIRENICGATGKRFGLSVNPHRFRNCGFTTMAVYAPEHIRAVSIVAGHAGPRMGDEHYNEAGSINASLTWNDDVEEILRMARERRRLGNRRSRRQRRLGRP